MVLPACDLPNEGEQSRNTGADDDDIHFSADQKRDVSSPGI